ncbi:MAG: hypothetical protein K9M07_00015 [Simkaniaceae bacterium]|nr:hypothetical protein [Simkaniaceae bacterium]MCF7851609.1 hypothetical protein [Simkaniaceae bacterium]
MAAAAIRSSLALIPTGLLLEGGFVPCSGELSIGIYHPNGINKTALSGVWLGGEEADTNFQGRFRVLLKYGQIEHKVHEYGKEFFGSLSELSKGVYTLELKMKALQYFYLSNPPAMDRIIEALSDFLEKYKEPDFILDPLVLSIDAMNKRIDRMKLYESEIVETFVGEAISIEDLGALVGRVVMIKIEDRRYWKSGVVIKIKENRSRSMIDGVRTCDHIVFCMTAIEDHSLKWDLQRVRLGDLFKVKEEIRAVSEPSHPDILATYKKFGRYFESPYYCRDLIEENLETMRSLKERGVHPVSDADRIWAESSVFPMIWGATLPADSDRIMDLSYGNMGEYALKGAAFIGREIKYLFVPLEEMGRVEDYFEGYDIEVLQIPVTDREFNAHQFKIIVDEKGITWASGANSSMLAMLKKTSALAEKLLSGETD